MSHLWLIGMMGAGKSAVGKALADRLSMPFSDMDAVIVGSSGMSVVQMWSLRGEEGFRTVESALIADLAENASSVIATGGGAVLDPASRDFMLGSGLVVWLTATLETLMSRIGEADDRPRLKTPNRRLALSEILVARQTVYDAASNVTVATDGLSVDTIVSRIEELWTEF